VRWIGNERGVAGETNWSTVDPAIVPVPGLSGDAVMRSLQQGDRDGTVWRPGETDVSIRPGWFYHPAEDARVRSIDNLVGLYFTSVGRNSKLLLNVPPTRAGLLHETDVARLAGMRRQLDALFAEDLASGASREERLRTSAVQVTEFELRRPVTAGIIDLREDIREGQIVARYAVEGRDDREWFPLSRGTTIGYRKLDRIQPARVRRVRVVVEEALEPPRPLDLRLYAGG
jgi:alpha-L-fucosidase